MKKDSIIALLVIFIIFQILFLGFYLGKESVRQDIVFDSAVQTLVAKSLSDSEKQKTVVTYPTVFNKNQGEIQTLYASTLTHTAEYWNKVKVTNTPLPYFTSTPTILDTAEPESTPTIPEHPYGTSGKCRDGEYTYAKHKQGACSSHGGIEEWWGN